MKKPMNEDESNTSPQVSYQESYAEEAKGIKPFAWVIGFSSALIIFGGLYIFQLFSTGLHQARLYAQMLEEVESKTPIKVKVTLPAVSALLSPKDGRVQRVADLIYLSESGHYDKALQRLKNATFPLLEANDEYEEALNALIAKNAPSTQSDEPEPLLVVAAPKGEEPEAAQRDQSSEPANTAAATELSVEDLKQELWAYGNAMLREIATPTIDNSVRRVYGSVIQHTKSKGYSFPPLPQRNP